MPGKAVKIMAVLRVEKDTNYTTMCNYHLRDKRLSLKAKGLLSMCLSLPDTSTLLLAYLTYCPYAKKHL